MYFLKYWLRKTWLEKCLKIRVIENLERDNKENGLKHCRNLNGTPFTIFINHCQGSCIGKSVFW